ncbi:MAG: DNA polymerase III subunit epsilon [Beijerinckiaceae bacterium]|nr:DNA polymerase III subunit epsilon [Beijerinckiaceae bacterium]MCI0734965.1 DNA polymerase III subunit epsilon [Beijerinckiaceae bacterium]
MREIVLDTETTGLDPASGHRIVEIGCVELLNAISTGEIFHAYIDPERDIPEAAFRVHGLSAEFLAGKAVFAEIAADFLKFTDGAKIVAHNAEFDLRFINAELALLGIEAISPDRVIDTLALARRKYPGGANSLDALCARFGVDSSRRTKHGALLDAEILAEVYAELTGGRQAALTFGLSANSTIEECKLLTQRPHPLPLRLSGDDLACHRVFVAQLGGEPVWKSCYGWFFETMHCEGRKRTG